MFFMCFSFVVVLLDSSRKAGMEMMKCLIHNLHHQIIWDTPHLCAGERLFAGNVLCIAFDDILMVLICLPS